MKVTIKGKGYEIQITLEDLPEMPPVKNTGAIGKLSVKSSNASFQRIANQLFADMEFMGLKLKYRPLVNWNHLLEMVENSIELHLLGDVSVVDKLPVAPDPDFGGFIA